ncbi:hypothetical protein [Sphingomonas sp.]|uniref:hypothetical protein n=1 Tax=Sphingomonas sp. TaxID=28214 RepID=UPI002FD9D92C
MELDVCAVAEVAIKSATQVAKADLPVERLRTVFFVILIPLFMLSPQHQPARQLSNDL